MAQVEPLNYVSVPKHPLPAMMPNFYDSIYFSVPVRIDLWYFGRFIFVNFFVLDYSRQKHVNSLFNKTILYSILSQNVRYFETIFGFGIWTHRIRYGLAHIDLYNIERNHIESARLSNSIFYWRYTHTKFTSAHEL